MYHVHSLHFGASHEDIAVLGQFYAEVITQCLYTFRKCACRVTKKAPNNNHNEFLAIFLQVHCHPQQHTTGNYSFNALKWRTYNTNARSAGETIHDVCNSIDAKTRLKFLKRQKLVWHNSFNEGHVSTDFGLKRKVSKIQRKIRTHFSREKKLFTNVKPSI